MNTDERTKDVLSAAIAKRLFGLELCNGDDKNFVRLASGGVALLKPFASDHNAALELVVPEMRKRGWVFRLIDCLEIDEVGVDFIRWEPEFREATGMAPFGQEPRAICLAALAALDQEESSAG